MRRLVDILVVALFATLVLVLFVAVQSDAEELPEWEVDDTPAPFHVDVPELSFDVALSEPEEWTEPEYVEPYVEEACCEPTYEPTYYEQAYAPSDGLTREGGINYHDGRLETYYSSNVLVHQDIGDWSTDDEGFYRTDEGYYVVAASDMEQGTVFEGSKGDCIVLDSGCADGTTDYYVAW